MDLKQLRYFCTAAKHQHISKAAEELFVSQPALSRMIRQLENELEVPLFEAEGRGIRLTTAGTFFYNAVSKALTDLDSAVREIQRHTQPGKGGVTVTNSIPELFPYLLRLFLQENPGIPITEFNSAHSLPEGADQMLSGCILSYEAPQLQGYTSEVLARIPFGFLIPPDHPLAARTSLTLEDARGLRHIAYAPVRFPRAFEQVMPYPDYVLSDLPSLSRLVAEGYGASLIPCVFWDLLRPELGMSDQKRPVLIRQSAVSESLNVYLAFPEGKLPSEAEGIFMSFCRSFFL